jgi:hypothetical protein
MSASSREKRTTAAGAVRMKLTGHMEKSRVVRSVSTPSRLFSLPLQKIGIGIYTSDYHRGGQLIWLMPIRDMAFP